MFYETGLMEANKEVKDLNCKINYSQKHLFHYCSQSSHDDRRLEVAKGLSERMEICNFLVRIRMERETQLCECLDISN